MTEALERPSIDESDRLVRVDKRFWMLIAPLLAGALVALAVAMTLLGAATEGPAKDGDNGEIEEVREIGEIGENATALVEEHEHDGPMLALVIDDWGYGWEAAESFLALDAPLNVAVIPHLPFSRRHAAAAAERGHQVLLHLPMEPVSPGWDLGEGGVTTAMTSDAIHEQVARAVDSLPYIAAVNNHMGSKATADPRVVRAVLEVVSERGLFFLDSRTTAESVVAEVASDLGVPFLLNDRFIDPDLDPNRVRERLLRGADLAETRGWAIVIGHVHPETYQGVVSALPELERRGVRLVHLGTILEKIIALRGDADELRRATESSKIEL